MITHKTWALAHEGTKMGFTAGVIVGIVICVVVVGYLVLKALLAFWNNF
jgi:dolichol kinase